MGNSKRPDKLYRYRPLGFQPANCESCGAENSASEIEKREQVVFLESCLYFPKRIQFNDPFDCTVPSMSGMSQKDRESFTNRRFDEEFKEYSESKRQEMSTYFKNCDIAEIERVNQENVDDFGILSLCEKPTNILMWSHYSNKHRGFCLEFDSSMHPACEAHHVNYPVERPAFDPGASAKAANAENFVLTKSRDWLYEAEWRVIYDKGSKNYPFPPEALTGVILGCETTEADTAKLKDWIRQGRCRPVLYKAVRKGSAFSLEIHPL